MNPSIHTVVFLDLKERNDAEINRIEERLEVLEAAIKRHRVLSDDERAELANLKQLQDFKDSNKGRPLDPLFIGARDLFGSKLSVTIRNHHDGRFPDHSTTTSSATTTAGSTADEEAMQLVRFAGVYGLLEADNVVPPAEVVKSAHLLASDVDSLLYIPFNRAFYAAVGEYDSISTLAVLVFSLLANEGSTGNGANGSFEVRAEEFAKVLRELVRQGVRADEPQLRRRVNIALDTIQSVRDDLPPSSIGIDLPELSETQDNALIAAHIRGVMPIYFSAMFEEMKVFQVVDKLVELFQDGVLPIGLGDAGNYLYKYWKETPNRISENERRNFYARVLGVPGGDAGGMPNRDFQDLWLRFVSAVSSWVRQSTLDNLLRSSIPGAVSLQQVRKAGYDLAANLSLHGYGMTYFAATELQKQIKDVIKLLSDRDIMSAYGGRDMWQVIDQVSAMELGGGGNTVRYRTMAASGAIIMSWLAKNTSRLVSTSYDPVLNVDEIRNPIPRSSGSKATTDPTDSDLVNACSQWLAVTGTEEAQVEQYAQPKQSPMTSSKPIQIPSIAKDVLESAGVSLGLGYRPNGRAASNGRYQ
jgi:hypothetical protein